MRMFLAAFTVAIASGPSLAGGPAVVVDDPAPVAAPTSATVHDWSGAYVGLSYGTTASDFKFALGSVVDLEGGNLLGAHAGYLFQRGSFVFGGELAYARINGMTDPLFFQEPVDSVVDLKAKAGIASNRVLFYGVVGYSMSEFNLDGGVWKTDGVALGAGVDFALSNRLSVGVEYLSRDLSGAEASDPDFEVENPIDTLSLRVSYSF